MLKRLRNSSMLILFALTLFLSAALLFSVQPLIAKMVLPLLGGTPAVWGTCMIFFQATLLGGYAYAHATTTWLPVRLQTIVHAACLLLPLLVLPFGISADAAQSISPGQNPTPWLLGLLLSSVGLPFFMVATSAPLLQRWFANTGHPSAADPYFLYGASNLGSMLALLSYPLVLEPNLRLAQQVGGWAAGYWLLIALTLCCALVVWSSSDRYRLVCDSQAAARAPDHLGVGQWLHWTVLAFIPSSLMLGVTTHLSTDIAAIPLLWVIPLSLYLLSFILTFAKPPPLPHRWMIRALPMAAAVLALVMSLSFSMQPIFIPIHLVTFFLAAMVCHGELVSHRPSHQHLTAFYLALSFGGVMGGVFNAIVAPIAFDRIAEYPLALVLACLVLPQARPEARGPARRALDLAIPIGIGGIVWGLVYLINLRPEWPQGDLAAKLVLGLAAFACYATKDRPVRFALGIGAVLLAGGTYTSDYGRVLYQHRSYYGVLRVTLTGSGNYRRLIHGHTLHGQQSLDPGRRREPLTYYHRTGPIGQVFDTFHDRFERTKLAVVGLGAGTLACYAEPGQRWTFYEIDPEVAGLARNPKYFTFLSDCRADCVEVKLGDARLRIRDAPEHGYGLIVMDAFSSDAIPIHLLTREALKVYRSKLTESGVMAFHISNNFVDLVPVLGALARDAHMNCLVRRDLDISPDDARLGKKPSIWAVIAADNTDIGGLSSDSRWRAPQIGSDELAWTDDFSNIIEHLIVLH